MAFYEIEFPLAAWDVDALEAALMEMGASAITFVDRGDEPVLEPKPGEVRLWSDTLVRALFADSIDPTVSLSRLNTLLDERLAASVRIKSVADRNWERVWLIDWKSLRFGSRLWVCPTTAAAPEPAGAVVVRLDPGLAFGTGTHPTTALCLQILESLPVSGRTVIDYGCGSGILGIAALKLGAAHVTAIDLDPQALTATRDNAARNGVSANIRVANIDADLDAAYCVMANILAGPLIELAPKLTAACEPGGTILLSGILKSQAHELQAAYSKGFDRARLVERDEWCCLYAQRQG